MDVDETEPERSTVDAPGSKDKEDPKSSLNIPEEQTEDMVVGDRIPGSGVRYPGFLIEWIFYWIESSQIKIFESIFELNFPGKKVIE